MRGSREEFLHSNFREVVQAHIDAVRQERVDGSPLLADRLQVEADAWESLGLDLGYFAHDKSAARVNTDRPVLSTTAFAEALVSAWADLSERDVTFLALVHFADAHQWSAYVRATSDSLQRVRAGRSSEEDVRALAWLLSMVEVEQTEQEMPATWRTRWDSEQLLARISVWRELQTELLEIARTSVNETQSRYFETAFRDISTHADSGQPTQGRVRAVSPATESPRTYDDHRVAFQTAGSVQITGGRPLNGVVHVRGAKNFVTKAMVAALLGDSESILRNVPDVGDVQVVRSLLEVHGVRVADGDESGSLVLDPSGAVSAHFEEIDAHAGASRVPILLCGPLLHLLGEALIPDLGGCRIGDRPINFHMDALRAFGAVVDKSYEGIRITAPNGLHGANIDLPYPSVGATEQVLLTAVRAKGVTELRNAAIEPEIMDLIAVLQAMGAKILVEANRVILIEGVDGLQGYDHWSIFDRNETASWACAALLTDGDIFVEGATPREMLSFLNAYRRVGGEFHVDEGGMTFKRAQTGELRPTVIETDVHPGFMTDWQPPLVVALTQAEGTSVVHETVYENRFGFAEALSRMGANIQVHGDGLNSSDRRVPRRALEQAAFITGPTPLRATDMRVEDLRGGWSLILAALIAQGESRVDNVGVLARGHEDLFAKLIQVGAAVEILEPWSSVVERVSVDA